MVYGLMNDLFNWMEENKKEVHPLILSSIFHYEFVFIHPFTDGNGRKARLWHSAILTKWQPIFEFIPIESQIEKFQSGYYDVISKCHTDGKSTAFIEFILEQINAILDEISVAVISPSSNISPYVAKLLNVMEFDTPYTANEILAFIEQRNKQKKDTKQLEKQVAKASFDQRQYDNLAYLYANSGFQLENNSNNYEPEIAASNIVNIKGDINV